MTDYADLEIDLRHQGGDTYEIDLRFSEKEGLTVKRLHPNVSVQEPILITIKRKDIQEIAEKKDDFAYGKLLSSCLFSDSRVHEFFVQARSHIPLRLRLVLGPQKPPPGAKPDFPLACPHGLYQNLS